MSDTGSFTRVLKHVWSDPKFVAEMEWFRDHPNPMQQVFAQLGSRPGSNVGDWLREVADEEVYILIHEPPDFDWWEPRHDQPWRRGQARDRQAGL